MLHFQSKCKEIKDGFLLVGDQEFLFQILPKKLMIIILSLDNNKIIVLMMEKPIRRRVTAYPRDFAPSNLSPSKNITKYFRKQEPEQEASNPEEITFQQENKDTSMSSYLVEQRRVHDQQLQNPLDQHLSKRVPIINQQLLNQPKMIEHLHDNLIEIEEPEGQFPTPGSIKNNKSQQPLSLEKPFQIKIPLTKEQKIHHNFEKTHSYFKKSLAGLNKPEKKFPTRQWSHESMRLSKRLITPKEFLRVRQESQNQLSRKKGLNFGYLFEEDRMNKLKQEINRKVQQKKKSQIKTQTSHQPFLDNSRSRATSFRSHKPISAFRGYPELGSQHEIYQPPRLQTITYKTSLNSLRKIISSINHSQNLQIQIKIPTILMHPYFKLHSSKQQLYEQSSYVFAELGIDRRNLTVKRFSNCIIVACDHIGMIWHYSGKVYLGGWKNVYLDEGVRHGLGLEWKPNQYVYYGEYDNNKRDGLGIMKRSDAIFAGEWYKGNETDNGYTVRLDGRMHAPAFQIPPEDFQRDPFQQ